MDKNAIFDPLFFITCFGKLRFISSQNLKSHFPLFSYTISVQAKNYGPETPEGNGVRLSR